MTDAGPLLAQRLFNTPVALHRARAELAIMDLAEQLGISRIVRSGGAPIEPVALQDDSIAADAPPRPSRGDNGYDILHGVAVLPVLGTLVHSSGSLRPRDGVTGYDGLRQAFMTAHADPNVKAIATLHKSKGGEVAGAADLHDAMMEMRGNKPHWAILNDHAYSADYWIASTADKIFVPRTGGLGSIAVMVMHVDMSEAISKAGLKVTFITSDGADRKADGHAEIPLSNEALASFQAEINAMGEIFYEQVAQARGLTADQVRDLKAATFMGANGVAAGLADAVMAPDKAFAELLAEIS